MTEGESEDTDPGGTSVLRVTCLEYVFGLRWIFQYQSRLNTLSIVDGIAGQSEIGNMQLPTNVGICGGFYE
ncbi:MAG: hypothetical protein M1556_00930 [Candidatus Thermoplasmatota archaeon]|nr:hypothetical protein [Candidatus Thermoplasmatota archaeon]MCL6002200.1 hypothetical protein [Candidatus Thermoplasmatota archaeon]